MVGYVCVVAGGKGGVGKTTTAINAGAALATAGHDVVLVDADLGMANLGAMLGIEPPASVHDVLAGEAKPEEALVTSDIGLAVLAGERRLEAYADADPAALGKLLEALRAEYDFVLVDTGAGLSHDLLVPIGVADGVLLVTTPDDVAIADAVKTLDLAGRVDADIIGAVLTRITAAVDVDAIADDLLVPLLGAIPEHGTDATAVVRTDPDGPAGSAYQDLADRLERIALEGANPASLAVTAESVELAAAAAGHGGEAVVDGDGEEAPSGSDASSAAADDESTTSDDGQSDSTADEDTEEPDEGESAAADQDDAAGSDDDDATEEQSSGGVFGLFR